MSDDDPQTDLALTAIDVDTAAHDLLKGDATRPSFAALYAYATDPNYLPSTDFEAQLATSPTLRTEVRRLLENVAKFTVSRQAAASTGRVTRRETDAVTLALTPSRSRPTQVFLNVTVADSHALTPRIMVLSHAEKGGVRVSLPPFVDGSAQIVLEAESDTAVLFSDPETEAFFV